MAAAAVINTKASRNVGECHGRGGGIGTRSTSQPLSGNASAMVIISDHGAPRICTSRARFTGRTGTRFMFTRICPA